MAEKVSVSVVYVDEKGELFEVCLLLPASATVHDALIESGLLARYPDWRVEELRLGVYSQRVALTDALHEADRIEIYRPLLIDPKDRRRKIVNQQRDPKKWRRVRA